MNYDIVTSKERLTSRCEPCESVETGESVGRLLLSVLERTKSGIGLAANQIGLNCRVCVINVTKPIILVNPRITGKFEKISFTEACLSFPGDYVKTERYGNIAVKADNHAETLFFDREKNLLECVCVQHEIDHLDGIIMHDRRKKGEKNG
tara:strand:- start:774 stop:1223 length:450 start_codon:yes stop_codon:yes gene_type:complete